MTAERTQPSVFVIALPVAIAFMLGLFSSARAQPAPRAAAIGSAAPAGGTLTRDLSRAAA